MAASQVAEEAIWLIRLYDGLREMYVKSHLLIGNRNAVVHYFCVQGNLIVACAHVPKERHVQ